MPFSVSRSLLLTLVSVLVSLVFVACGGGGGGSGTVSPAGTGDVALLLTDGPADDFDEINITVVKAELFGDDGKVTVFEGNKTFNLLDLKDDARVFAIRRHVPAGYYHKIRLTLTHLELVKKDDDGNVIETAAPKLPGNGKLDLVPRGEFSVTSGKTLMVQIDMDANKSIHIVGTGGGKYQFRPVVFVDVVSGAFPGKFVQLHGVVEDIDAVDPSFKLCRTDIPVRHHDDDDDDDDSPGCIEVAVADDTSIFDEDGQPSEFSALTEGEEVTVFGRFRREDDDDDDDDDDSDDDDDDDGDDDDGDRHENHELDDLELVALLIERGPEGAFQAIDGVAQSDVDVNDQFSLDIDAGQGFVAGTSLTVQLQDGTWIINRYGKPLSVTDIDPGVPLTARGVLDLSTDPDTLYASLVVLDSDASRLAKISGALGEYPDGSCGLAIMTDTGDRSVRIGDDTRIFLITSTDSSGASEQITADDLVNGQSADVYGEEALDGCFDAETIIAFELGAQIP